MRTLHKVVLLSLAVTCVMAITASSASAVEVVRESDGAKCTETICAFAGHDVGGAEFHDVFNLFHGVCDVEMEGGATHAGIATASSVTITDCVGDQFSPCGTWSLTLTSTTAADGQLCATVNGGSTQYKCSLSNMTVTESTGHNYAMSDNGGAGEQACDGESYYVDVTLALEYDASHPTLEVR